MVGASPQFQKRAPVGFKYRDRKEKNTRVTTLNALPPRKNTRAEKSLRRTNSESRALKFDLREGYRRFCDRLSDADRRFFERRRDLRMYVPDPNESLGISPTLADCLKLGGSLF